MLASSQSSKFPPLSYAERVKNAQNSKPNNPGPSQRLNAAPPVTSPLPGASTSTGSSSAASNGSATSLSADSNHTSAITSPAKPLTPFVQPTENNDGKIINGDARDEKQPPTTPQKSVNVWDLRKEQMAARASVSRLPQSKSLQLNQPSSPSSVLPPASRSVDALSYNPANGNIPPPFAPDDDPFIVRVPSRPPPAPTEDAESWPEVGKSIVTNPTPHVTQDRVNNGEPSENGPPTSTPRKSEKTKWVPIPPQELQAAADAAMKSQHRSHSRNLSRHSNTGPRHNHQGSGSASGSVYEQTRSHSGRNSTSQSQVQSRTGSVHSSPLFPRGRRLPNDEPPTFEYPPHTDSILVRTSRAGSPQVSPQSSRQSHPFVDSNGITAPYSHGIYAPLPENGATTYYSHPPPPPSLPVPSPGPQNQPYPHHSPQNSIQSLYGPNGVTNFPNQSPDTLPPPVPGYPGVPSPYPMYPTHQFDYSQGPSQPYMYWNGSGHNTPPYPPPMSHYNFPPPLPPQNYPPSDMPISDAPPLSPANVQPPISGDADGTAPESRLMEQPVIFGSVGVPGASQAPSPVPQPAGSTHDDISSINTSFTVLAIGVNPGDRSRNRPRSNKAQNRTETRNNLSTSEQGERLDKPAVDLDRKWEFGTTGLVDSEIPPPALASPPVEATPVQQDVVPTSFINGDVNASVTPSPLVLESSVPSLSPSVQQMRPSLIPPPFMGPRGSLSPLDVESSRAQNEWEVQDFGYGFGMASGSGYAVALTREQMDVRERERVREMEIERERVEAQKDDLENVGPREAEFSGRPRRASYNGGFYERPYRRGRGYGRGRRGGGFHSSSRYSITPPQNFQSLGPFADSSNGFYSQAPPPSAYIPTGYESYPHLQPAGAQPPVPVPLSTLSFPLDSTRYYLLGQLEYYLSPQNMAQDFFLRQQMDSRGWIPITLLASFNRVKRLAADVQLVRDVLVLSSVLEVRDGWVRMRGWEQFVLPDAADSRVEQFDTSTPNYHEHENNYDEEDEEEEEVVFVMGREAALWTPERSRP